MATDVGLRRIVRQGASVGATRIALIGSAFVSSIVVARALSIEERGRFGLLMASAGLAIQFGNFGLPIANTYLVARRPELAPAIVANTGRFLLVVSLLTALIGLSSIPFFPVLLPLRGMAGASAWLMTVMGLAMMMAQSLLVGQLKFSINNCVDGVARVGSIVGMSALWAIGGRNAAWFGFATASFTGVAAWWGLRAGRVNVSLAGADASLARTQMHLGTRAYIACVASFIVARLPLYAVESRSGLQGLAYFTQALGVSDSMLVLPAALGTVIFPNLATSTDPEARIRSTLKMAFGVSIMMLVAALAVAWTGPTLLPLVYGKAYSASMPYLLVMLPGVVALGVCSIVQTALCANGYPWAAVAAPLAGVVTVGAVLSATRGPLGCGWAYSIGGCVMLASSCVAWWLNRHRLVVIGGHAETKT